MNLRLVRTVRHLRARQLVGQVRVRLGRYLDDHEAFVRQAVPEFPGCAWAPKVGFLAPGPQLNHTHHLRQGHFNFLNDSREIGWPPRWDADGPSKLWLYNLFYFEYLWALEYEDAKTIVLDWINRYGLATESIGWQSYPISLRLMNWCCVFWGKHREQVANDVQFQAVLWQSIFMQAEWLRGHLETHLLGNHLFENAAALTLVGACFGGPAARLWSQTGRDLLWKEVAEQVLPDGGHFERSPMYQSRVGYVLATLLNVADTGLRAIIREPLGRLIRSLRALAHPDGGISLFNDSALEVYNLPSQIAAYVAKIEGRQANLLGASGAFSLPDTGYYGWRSPSGTYLICDAGPIGPDYLPGHAHGDIFSFELSLNGHRVVVDSGVHDYEVSESRRYCRSTAAHNTVEIDGQDQCEFWAAFRVARRGRPRNVRWNAGTNGFRLAAWHDGYQRLASRAKHSRQFVWHEPGVLMVRDRTAAKTVCSVVSRLHLHPQCRVTESGRDWVRVEYPAGNCTVSFAGSGRVGIEEYSYCPQFGKSMRAPVISYSLRGAETLSGFCLLDGSEGMRLDLKEGAVGHERRYVW
jgi:uncharacterized heparinase superfamily protein